jgi:hypothetical protein
MDALDWFVHRRSNPMGEMSITEACIEVMSGKNAGSGQGWNPDARTAEDGLITMADISKLLDKFPPFIVEMMLIWAVDKEKKTALKHGCKVNFLFRKKQVRQQYNILNDNIERLSDMLFENDYLHRSRRTQAKKISHAS